MIAFVYIPGVVAPFVWRATPRLLTAGIYILTYINTIVFVGYVLALMVEVSLNAFGAGGLIVITELLQGGTA